MVDSSKSNNEYWRDKLSAEEFHICREKGTERPFTGEYWDSKAEGTYLCRCCGEALFSSAAKYDSGSGWPSFTSEIKPGVVAEKTDASLAMVRTEILCERCGCHLGHVFPDGPGENGLRYCVNSASIQMQAAIEASDDNSNGEGKSR